MNTVEVTNTGKDAFEDGYAGIRYVFEPGQKLSVPYEAAAHIFGYGMKDKEDALARLGWIETHKDLPEGLKRLAKFKIEGDGKHHLLSPVVQRVPLNSPKGEGGKLSVSPDAGQAVPLSP